MMGMVILSLMQVRVAEGLVGVLVGLPPAADKEIKKKDYRTTSGTAGSCFKDHVQSRRSCEPFYIRSLT